MTKQVSTVKINIKSLLTPEQREIVYATAKEFGDAFDFYTALSCKLQTSNDSILHKNGYHQVRVLSPNISSNMTNAARGSAIATVKTHNSSVKRMNKQIKRRNARWKKYCKAHNTMDDYKPKPFKEEWKYEGKHHRDSYKMSKHDISVLKGGRVSFGTTNGRIVIDNVIPKWFDEKYPHRRLYSGSISCKKDGRIILYISFVLTNEEGEDLVSNFYSKEDILKMSTEDIVGIDRGIYHPVATSNGLLISSKPTYKVQRKYNFDETRLKSKGASSARRRLRATKGKVRRYISDVNHCRSKEVSQIPAKIFVFENLTGVKDKRTWSKSMRRMVNSWSFKDFEEKTKYKAERQGKVVMYVHPAYTSQECSNCHVIANWSRFKNWFHCTLCGHKEHADLNAAKNIRDRLQEGLRSTSQGAFNRPVSERNLADNILNSTSA